MNDQNLSVYNCCDGQEAENILKQLKDLTAMSLVLLHDFLCEPVSEVHYVVFMVSSVQVHVVWVKQKEGKQQDNHFN